MGRTVLSVERACHYTWLAQAKPDRWRLYQLSPGPPLWPGPIDYHRAPLKSWPVRSTWSVAVGSVLRASCTCGYEAEDLMEGSGMQSDGSTYVLATCASCQQVASVRTPSKRYRCPSCRRAIRLHVVGDNERIDGN